MGQKKRNTQRESINIDKKECYVFQNKTQI